MLLPVEILNGLTFANIVNFKTQSTFKAFRARLRHKDIFTGSVRVFKLVKEFSPGLRHYHAMGGPVKNHPVAEY